MKYFLRRCSLGESWLLVVGASVFLACGSTATTMDPPDATGGVQNSPDPLGSGGESGSSGGQSAGSGGASTAIGNGERDATCRARTSNHVGGERIVLRNAVTAEGDQVFLGFYDTERELECDIRQDSEGTFRCMPLTRGLKDLNNLYFLDEQCAEEVDYRGICAKDHDAVLVSPDDPSDERRRFFALGEPLPDSQVYSRNAEGACEAYGMLNHLRTVGPELDPHDFAEVDPVTWRGAGRIWTVGYQSDDGLQVAEKLLDSELNQHCDFETLSDGAEHCTPTELGILGFTDPSCKEKLVTSFYSCEAPLTCYAAEQTSDICRPANAYFKSLNVHEGENYLASSCGIAMNQEAVTYLTESVPDSAFAAVESTSSAEDNSRLRARYRDSADGGCFFQDWWDEELQSPCVFGKGPSGNYYCLPAGETTTSILTLETFSDSSCEQQVHYQRVPACSGAKTPLYLVTLNQTCDGSWRDVRPIEPDVAELPPLWMKSGDTCVQFMPQADMNYHELGEIMPPGAFVEATPEL